MKSDIPRTGEVVVPPRLGRIEEESLGGTEDDVAPDCDEAAAIVNDPKQSASTDSQHKKERLRRETVGQGEAGRARGGRPREEGGRSRTRAEAVRSRVG